MVLCARLQFGATYYHAIIVPVIRQIVSEGTQLHGLPNSCAQVIFFFFFFFETEFRSCYPGWSAMAQSQLTTTSASWVQAILPQPPGITGTRHHAQLIFVFLVETVFHLADQDCLDLLTS